MAPGSILHYINLPILSYFYCFLFYFPIYIIKIPKIFILSYYLCQISLSQVIVKGLTTPLSRWVQVVDCLCKYFVTCVLSPTELIPWFSKLREILTLLCCITLSSSRENQRSAQEVARRISRAVAGEVFAQVKTYQVPIRNPSPSHLHYLPFASRFPLPHFTFAFSSPSFRSILCYHVPYFCLHLCLLKIY